MKARGAGAASFLIAPTLGRADGILAGATQGMSARCSATTIPKFLEYLIFERRYDER